jgi:hypothetical protein
MITTKEVQFLAWEDWDAAWLAVRFTGTSGSVCGPIPYRNVASAVPS